MNALSYFRSIGRTARKGVSPVALPTQKGIQHVFNSISIGPDSQHDHKHRFGNSDNLGRNCGGLGRLPLAPLRFPQGARRYPLGWRKTALSVALGGLIVLFSFTQTAQAAVLFGVSGSSYKSERTGEGTATGAVFISIGRGYTGSLKYLYAAVDDDLSQPYMTIQLYECSNGGGTPPSFVFAQASGDVCFTSTSFIYTPTASQSLTADLFVKTQTGVGRRLLEADFSYYRKTVVSTGTTTAHAGPITLDASKYYMLKVSACSSNAYTNNCNSNGVAVYGIQTQLVDAYGNKMWSFHGRSGQGATMFQDANIGTGYHYGADEPLTWQDVGFYTPASSSSQSSLSGAATFCAGVASSSTAFGIPYGLCYIAGFLFVPAQSAVQEFWDNASLVKNVPPWSYGIEIKEAFDVATSGSAKTVPKVQVPWHVFGASTSLTILSSASWTYWVSSSTLSTVRDLTTVAFYFAFGFYLYRRGRHFLKSL